MGDGFVRGGFVPAAERVSGIQSSRCFAMASPVAPKLPREPETKPRAGAYAPCGQESLFETYVAVLFGAIPPRFDPLILTLTGPSRGASQVSLDGFLTAERQLSGDSVAGEAVKRFRIVGAPFILLALVAISTSGCTRAGSSRTHARSLKPSSSATPHFSGKPAQAEPSVSSYLPIESW